MCVHVHVRVSVGVGVGVWVCVGVCVCVCVGVCGCVSECSCGSYARHLHVLPSIRTCRSCLLTTENSSQFIMTDKQIHHTLEVMAH